jgi:hypothetical protein
MANEFIARKGFISLTNAQITGSLSVTGDVSASAFSGSFIGDGSQLSGIEGFPFTGSAGITGSLTVVGPVNATTFTGDGSQLTGIEGFPYTGSAGITGSLIVNGNVEATSFTGSLQGTSTSSSYVQLVDVDGFTAYSSSVNTAIDSVLDATTPLTATVNTTNTPFTLTSQSIVVADSTNGNLTINLPDLDAIVGTSDQKPIIVYKNDYSQNVIYVQPSGSQLVNGASQDIIVSIQLAVIYNPTSAGWVTEGTSAQSLAELELFFVPRTETGSFATTGSNQFDGNQTITGSLTVTGGINATITGSATSSSYVEYTDVANKPTLVSGSEQISFNGITDKPALVSSSAQIVEYGIFTTTGSNQFDGNQAITGSLTVTGQVVAQTLNVQQVTSSIVYSSGSNIFGNSLDNTQQFTGSLQVSGSSHYVLGNMGIGTITPLSRFHVNTGTNQNLRVRPGTDVGATNGVALNSRSDDDGTLLQLALRASDVIMLPSGNVGINTASPTDFIDAGLGLAIINTTGRSGLSLGSTQGTANEVLGRLSFTNTNSTNIGNKRLAYISGIRGTSDNSAYLEFGTADNALGTQRMVITQGGNVGINTNNPSSALDVVGITTIGGGSDGSGLRLRGTDGVVFRCIDPTALGGISTINFGAVGTSTGNIRVHATDVLFLSNGGDAERMRITAGGNVGIGLTDPPTRLSLVGGSTMQFGIDGNSGNNLIYLRGGSTGDKANIILNHYGYADYHIAVGHTANTLLSLTKTLGGIDGIIINSSGNVGIGTSTPEVSFVVKGSSIGSGGKASFYGGGDENNWSANNNEAIRIGRADILNAFYSSIWSASGSGGNELQHWLRFYISNGSGGQTLATTMFGNGNVSIEGALSKGSGSFKIDHPLLSKKNTHHLVHSFIEGPQADNIYRGKIQLVNGKATVNLDQSAKMTEGTFVLLNGNIQCFTSNESGWTAVKGIVAGNILTIEAQDTNCADTISWLVIGERIDQHMLDTDWTDENGKVITEPLKQ